MEEWKGGRMGMEDWKIGIERLGEVSSPLPPFHPASLIPSPLPSFQSYPFHSSHAYVGQANTH